MILYIAGPYRGDVGSNIKLAREMAIKLWEAGHVAITPHLNTQNFEDDCILKNGEYIVGDLKILARCDGILMLPGWEDSEGARVERRYAHDRHIPIYNYPDIPPLNFTETRCPRQCEEFVNVVMEAYRLHLSKNEDYSPANLLATGEIGLITRLWDKAARLLNLCGFTFEIGATGFNLPKEPKNETIDDTLIDAANYSIIGLIMRRGKWGK